MTIRMTGNHVLLEPLPKPTASTGGILLAMAQNDDRKQWRVVAVGPGRKTKKGVLVAPEVAPGDRVVAELFQDHLTLPDGSVVADASNIVAKW